MAEPGIAFDLVSGAAQAASGLFAAEITDKTIGRLVLRCERATGDLSAAAQSLIDAASSSHAASKAAVRSLQRHRSLWFDKHMEELDAGSKLLVAAARIPVGSGMEEAELATSLEALLPLTSSSLSVYQSNYIDTPADGLGDLRAVLEAVTRLQVAVSAVTSVLSGPGVRWFKSGLTVDAASHNVIRVDARDVLGEALRSLSVEDIDVRVTGTGASLSSVSLAAPSMIEISYQVTEITTKEISLNLLVDAEVFPTIRLLAGHPIEGSVANTYKLPTSSRSSSRIGMALSPAEDILAVSLMDGNCIEVYAFPEFNRIRTIGSTGTGLCQFRTPYKLCFSSNESLLVADCGNNRVQEVTVTGEHIRIIGEGVLPRPFGLAINLSAQLLAVASSSLDVRVVLFDLESGGVVRSISDTQLSSPMGIRFTPDLAHFAVPSQTGTIIVYTLDGVIVSESVLIPTPTDVDFATNGDLLVSENSNCLYILSPDGTKTIRVMNFSRDDVGVEASAVSYPMALAMRRDGNVLLLSQFGTHVVEIS